MTNEQVVAHLRECYRDRALSISQEAGDFLLWFRASRGYAEYDAYFLISWIAYYEDHAPSELARKLAQWRIEKE